MLGGTMFCTVTGWRQDRLSLSLSQEPAIKFQATQKNRKYKRHTTHEALQSPMRT